MVAAAMCRKSAQKLDNFVVYSDDNGHTWHVSDRAFSVGDEAKLMELRDGTILISVRQNGPRGCNHSSDGGQTWGTQSTWPEMTANTWHSPVSLFEGPSVYSSLTLMPDGTIGAYIEQNPSGACELWFYRFQPAYIQ